MIRVRNTSLVVLLIAMAGFLASCGNETTTAPAVVSADKGGLIFPEELVDPHFLRDVIEAYDALTWQGVDVTIELGGCEVVVTPPDWPAGRYFIVSVPYNPNRSGTHTFRIEYPKADYDPDKPPTIPGDVTMYRFHGLPKLKRMHVVMPPAPWYDGDHLGGVCSVYQVLDTEHGGFTAADLQTVAGDYHVDAAAFLLPFDVVNKPDNPARWLLDTGEPGDGEG